MSRGKMRYQSEEIDPTMALASVHCTIKGQPGFTFLNPTAAFPRLEILKCSPYNAGIPVGIASTGPIH